MHHFPARFAAMLLIATSSVSAMAQQVGFTIWKGDEMVGAITALRRPLDQSTVYAVSSYSEMEIVTKQVVRSSMAVEYRAGRPVSCFSSFHLNEMLRDSTRMRTDGDSLACFRHPRKRFTLVSTPQWTTSRMYFEEPVGQTAVFVESELRPCELKKTDPGIYILELPGNRTNIYHYSGGKLQQVEVNRTLMKLVFRRA